MREDSDAQKPPLTVLPVDDEDAVRHVVGLALERGGHKVLVGDTPAIVVRASDGKVLFANPSAAQAVGCTSEALTGMSVFELASQDDAPRLHSAIGACIGTSLVAGMSCGVRQARVPEPRLEDSMREDSDAQKPPLTVLLVDDEDAVRHVVGLALERGGHKVLHARSAAEALNVWSHSAQEIDAVVTDLVMPEMSGGELLARLLESRPRLAAVCMSGFSDVSLASFGIGDSIPFLRKPFRTRELLAAVEGAAEAGGRARRAVPSRASQ